MPHSIVVHLDMNSYFASVEQQANPFLRGRPLGVCAYLHPGGCVIAASIEAKERGMKVGMRMEDAKRLIPDAVFIQNDPAKYRSITSKIFSILHEVCDRVEHYSIDEAFLDLSGWVRDEAEAAWIMIRIRERVYHEVGEWLRCSIGIAKTRFLAKLGSDMQKPSGLTIITPENLDSILATLELEDICGIGPRIGRRLKALGYQTPLDVKRASVSNLMNAFGKMGYVLWAKLHGHDIERVRAEYELPKSIGHSYCVPRKTNREGNIEAILTKLAERAARRLRSHGLFARMVIVSIGFNDAEKGSFFWGSESAFFRLENVVNDSFTLIRTAIAVLYQLWDRKRLVRFLAVTYTEFGISSGQTHFCFERRSTIEPSRRGMNIDWNDEARQRRFKEASCALDAIKDKHGDSAIFLGRMFGVTVDDAPDRIGFRNVNGIHIRTPA